MWNEGIIEAIRTEDKTPELTVVRAAQRIVQKGFMLVDYKRRTVARGFDWGRSSTGQEICVLYTITFENDAHEEFAVLVADCTVRYDRKNPYDRAPKGTRSVGLQATDASKAALGWKG